VSTDGRQVLVHSRNGRDVTGSYPELAALADLDGGPALLDGELVALHDGRPDFGTLQSRMHVQTPSATLISRVPVTFFPFDLLHLGRRDLARVPYLERRDHLASLHLEAPPLVRTPEHYLDVDGRKLLDVAREHGLEGVVAKRTDSHYQPGIRARSWIKTALRLTQEVVIGGWTEGEGRRRDTLGSLLLGVYDDDGRLHYAGHVGTGFTEDALRDMLRRLEPLARPTSPFADPVPGSGHAGRTGWNLNWSAR
jgi:bifunctional non-homologous end joining protein LigD